MITSVKELLPKILILVALLTNNQDRGWEAQIKNPHPFKPIQTRSGRLSVVELQSQTNADLARLDSVRPFEIAISHGLVSNLRSVINLHNLRLNSE